MISEQVAADGLARANLIKAVAPRSIAVLGASDRPGSFGRSTIENLSNFTGSLYLVNAKYQRLGERDCFDSLASLPEVPDCVLVALPSHAVEPVVRQCAELGVAGAVIYASGYAETGKPENVQRQKALSQIASRTGLRIFGPNCLGIVNYINNAVQSFSYYPRSCKQLPHSIGLVSQSGALALSLAQSIERGCSFSHVLSFGNACDVDAADLVELLALDGSCKAIACLFEGSPNPLRLVNAARVAWRNEKPLVVFKLARGAEGARAAMSHTGSLAGSYATYRAMLEEAGAILVDNFEALLEVTSFFAKAAAPKANGVAVVTASGGAGIMAADKAELHGISLPQPSASTREVLASHIPDFGSTNNPVDATAEVVNKLSSLEACCEAMASDPGYGAIVVAHPVAADAMTPRLGLYAAVAQRHEKPVCALWLSQWQEGPGAAAFEASRVATFHSIDNCFFSLAAWQRRHRLALRPASSYPQVALEAVSAAAADIRSGGGLAMTERASKKALKHYGVPTSREELVWTPQQAVAAARQIGYPVVLKIESSDIPHKTEAGVVRLGVPDDRAVERAFAEIQDNASKAVPQRTNFGVLVQEMVSGGLEVIVGGKVDPDFGPLLMVGLGGVLAELLKDTCLAPAPVTPDRAREMLESLKGAMLFRGFRSMPSVDLERLSEIVSRISLFIRDQKDLVAELDVNPLICSDSGIRVVDALVIRKPS